MKVSCFSSALRISYHSTNVYDKQAGRPSLQRNMPKTAHKDSDTKSSEEPKAKKATPTGHWSQGLYAALHDETLHLYSDEHLVIIKDKYPKAKYHYLILPKKKIANLKSLKAEDLPLLEKLYQAALKITKDATVKSFRYGYHAIPSMGLLHLHAISQDFNSPSLKNKKHWNSFTSEYFIDSQKVIDMLKKNGKVDDMSSMASYLTQDLKCHCCGAVQKNIPTLKSHISKCWKDSS